MGCYSHMEPWSPWRCSEKYWLKQPFSGALSGCGVSESTEVGGGGRKSPSREESGSAVVVPVQENQ